MNSKMSKIASKIAWCCVFGLALQACSQLPPLLPFEKDPQPVGAQVASEADIAEAKARKQINLLPYDTSNRLPDGNYDPYMQPEEAMNFALGRSDGTIRAADTPYLGGDSQYPASPFSPNSSVTVYPLGGPVRDPLTTPGPNALNIQPLSQTTATTSNVYVPKDANVQIFSLDSGTSSTAPSGMMGGMQSPFAVQQMPLNPPTQAPIALTPPQNTAPAIRPGSLTAPTAPTTAQEPVQMMPTPSNEQTESFNTYSYERVQSPGRKSTRPTSLTGY